MRVQGGRWSTRGTPEIEESCDRRLTSVTGNLLRVLLALELALEGLDEVDHVGLALAEEVDLCLEDLVVRVLFAALEEVEDGEHELAVEVREELGERRR